MSKTLQFRRGTTAELSTVCGSVAELFIDTSKNTVVLMDGSTAGGITVGNLQGNIQLGKTGANEIDTSSGNLTIDSAGGTVTVDDNLVIAGDLTVQGTTTTVNSTTIDVQNSLRFEGATSDAFETNLTVTDPTADRTITLPNATGYVPVFTSQPTSAIADGTSGQVLTTNGSGALSFATVGADLVNDTTPQLGGSLSLNSNDITGTGNINITGSVTATSFSGDLTGNLTGNTQINGDLTFYSDDGNTLAGSIRNDNGRLEFYNEEGTRFFYFEDTQHNITVDADLVISSAKLLRTNKIRQPSGSTGNIDIEAGSSGSVIIETGSNNEINVTNGLVAVTGDLTLSGNLTVNCNPVAYRTRTVAECDGVCISINADCADMITQDNTQGAGTLTVNSPTGCFYDGQRIMLRVKSTNAQTLSFDAVYDDSDDLTLPTSTSGSSKTDYLGFAYNNTSCKWEFVGKIFGF